MSQPSPLEPPQPPKMNQEAEDLWRAEAKQYAADIYTKALRGAIERKDDTIRRDDVVITIRGINASKKSNLKTKWMKAMGGALVGVGLQGAYDCVLKGTANRVSILLSLLAITLGAILIILF